MAQGTLEPPARKDIPNPWRKGTLNSPEEFIRFPANHSL